MKKVCRATTLHAPFGISNTYNNLQYCGNCRRESCMHVIIKPLEIYNLFYTQIFPILGVLDSCLKLYMDFDFRQWKSIYYSAARKLHFAVKNGSFSFWCSNHMTLSKLFEFLSWIAISPPPCCDGCFLYFSFGVSRVQLQALFVKLMIFVLGAWEESTLQFYIFQTSHNTINLKKRTQKLCKSYAWWSCTLLDGGLVLLQCNLKSFWFRTGHYWNDLVFLVGTWEESSTHKLIFHHHHHHHPVLLSCMKLWKLWKKVCNLYVDGPACLPTGGVFLLHYCLFSLIFRVDFCSFRFSVLRQFNLLLRVFVSWFVMLSSSLQILCFAQLWTLICTFFGNKEAGKGDWKSKEVYQKKNQVRSAQRVLSGILNLLHELWLIHLPLDDHQSTNLTKLKTKNPGLGWEARARAAAAALIDAQELLVALALAILHKRT